MLYLLALSHKPIGKHALRHKPCESVEVEEVILIPPAVVVDVVVVMAVVVVVVPEEAVVVVVSANKNISVSMCIT